MFELYKAEFKRHLKWSFLAAILHLIYWSAFGAVESTIQHLADGRTGTFMSFIALGALFGAFQMWHHTKKDHWSFLIHRPLSASRIYLSIMAAAMSHIVIVFLLPWLLFVCYADLFTNAIVDTRHYYHGILLFLFASGGYFIGSLSVLHTIAALFISITFPFVNILMPSDMAYPSIIIGSGLIYLNLKSFKADLSSPLRSKTALVVMTLSLNTGISVALFLVSQACTMINCPGNYGRITPTAGSYKEFVQKYGNMSTNYAYALKGSSHKRASEIITNIDTRNGFQNNFWATFYTKEGQLPHKDKRNRTTGAQHLESWWFSHNQMVLGGVNLKDKSSLGWIGRRGFIDSKDTIQDEDRFNSVPRFGKNYIYTKTELYHIDFKKRGVALIHSLPEGEEYLMTMCCNGPARLITNKNSYIINAPLNSKTGQADYTVPHPIELNAAKKPLNDHFTFNKYDDDYVITYQGISFTEHNTPSLVTVLAKKNGGVERLGTISFPIPEKIADFNTNMRGLFISPLTFLMSNALLREKGQNNIDNAAMNFKLLTPLQLFIFIALQLISPVIVYLLAMKYMIKRDMLVFWVILAAASGLPSIISFLFLNRINIWSKLHYFTLPNFRKKGAA